MKYFSYKELKNKDSFFVENISVDEIAKHVGTPFYCYSKHQLVENFKAFDNALKNSKIKNYKICYAIKANHNIHLVKILQNLGAGIDAVSGGEVFKSIKAGIDPRKIVFAGVGKTYEEIRYAIASGVEEFSAESEAEIFLLNKVSKEFNKKIKLSIRVNPNIDAKTHDKISTGRKGDKFGIDIDDAFDIYLKIKDLPNLEIHGISTHIGSQILNLEPFKAAFIKVIDLFHELKKENINIKNLDLGGGIGITYNNETTVSILDYIKLIEDLISDLNISLTLAPGRAIVGTIGIMVSKIIYLKETSHKNFIIIDAAMNDLMRPGLYDSYHQVIQSTKKHAKGDHYDIVGPICESTDVLAKNRYIIEPNSGENLIFCSAGAYGSAMSNEYNLRPLIPEVLVEDNTFRVIRKRPTYEEMLNLEN